ncbi:oxidoreductase [Amycolatopsis rhabdoformis]|uniref:Oxidoreductase n=1 Tax=Amycolatopsis rhabdoformis TaxID=1448059 RepID=A0ABZ1IK00_9PSEU|nr:oxidoreductase [Amycolatopsis rhabdoformis]WSE34830.1 oxidoreductase [Amycolatopsis rhabdoformis]
MSVWFITGASRGFGLEIARAALERGDQVVATARQAAAVEKEFPGDPSVLAVALDVTDPAQASAAVGAALDRFGRIDVLVNNAGRGLLGAVEEASDAAVRAVFDANVFGLLSVTRAVLPVLRRQRSGHVVNISSVGGFTTGPGWGVYGATKFAVEALSEALHGELAPLGVHVTVVEPGYFRTDFLDASSLHRADEEIADYATTVGSMRAVADSRNHAQPGDPRKAALAIVSVVGSPSPPLRLQLGADAVGRVSAKLDFVRDELSRWRELSVSTDHG